MAYSIRCTPVAGKAESAEAQLTTTTVRRPCGFFPQTRVAPTVCPRFASRMPEKPSLSASLSSSPRRVNSSCRVVPACFCASKSSPGKLRNPEACQNPLRERCVRSAGQQPRSANTYLRWLSRDQPDAAEAREATSRIIKDITRASDIISRSDRYSRRRLSQQELLDVNRVIQGDDCPASQ